MAQSAPATATHTSFGGILDRMTEGLTRGLTFLVENNPRYGQISAINGMSDAELSKRGTTRADLVRKVFSDRYYL
ncbi:hypothetical protein OCH239_18395 [Roseivivax halodurans JCM 10272]|uniref:DUF1127 domain-containing protein n=1 Tax=Roseivivax halodurans JCM 10272 TaxID=1449350 RepID=X7EJB7_9RHOB|nr:hypothetical protein [Roseivivax halodurans]ETX15248.1 hypothetical protein OCH239_18395 [Roseivivax halodurans JCM 10272]